MALGWVGGTIVPARRRAGTSHSPRGAANDRMPHAPANDRSGAAARRNDRIDYCIVNERSTHPRDYHRGSMQRDSIESEGHYRGSMQRNSIESEGHYRGSMQRDSSKRV